MESHPGAPTEWRGKKDSSLPWGAPPHGEASHVEANTRVACHCGNAGVESGDGLALVDCLDALIRELAEAIVGTVKVANLLGQAVSCEQSVDECITGRSWERRAQAPLGPLDALLVIDVASSPLVGDWVALSQALGDIEAIWDLGNAHDTAVVVVLAGTLEADNLIVQCHLLALGIAGRHLQPSPQPKEMLSPSGKTTTADAATITPAANE